MAKITFQNGVEKDKGRIVNMPVASMNIFGIDSLEQGGQIAEAVATTINNELGRQAINTGTVTISMRFRIGRYPV